MFQLISNKLSPLAFTIIYLLLNVVHHLSPVGNSGGHQLWAEAAAAPAASPIVGPSNWAYLDNFGSNSQQGDNYATLRQPSTLQLELERESTHQSAASSYRNSWSHLSTPADVGRQLFRQGRLAPGLTHELIVQRQQDLFECVEPRGDLFTRFLRQFNRTNLLSRQHQQQHQPGDGGGYIDEEYLDRLDLYATTLKRATLFNRLIQNQVLNRTNYQVKPEIRNYHFIEPVKELTNGRQQSNPEPSSYLLQLQSEQQPQQQTTLWFADLNDCELGLIKDKLFRIFDLVDENEFRIALAIANVSSEYLPLISQDGFEQLANILLLRLFERFQGDHQMNQLFQWPLYLKKLASYAYSRQEMLKPDFKSKLALISFAYPSYFKDLKYNWPAINRTGDNVEANKAMRNFTARFRGGQIADLQERNKRLAIFRQRWSLINQLNNDESSGMNILQHLQPDWYQLQYLNSNNLSGESAKLINFDDDQQQQQQSSSSSSNGLPLKPKFQLTQFSDLTDVEFVAFLNNDYSLLERNQDSQEYLQRHFKVQPLDAEFRDELALELELRRANLANSISGQTSPSQSISDQQQPPLQTRRPGLQLARQVIDELISDVGLPIGPVSVDLDENEAIETFDKLIRLFKKVYSPTTTTTATTNLGQLSLSDLSDEQRHRYNQFKINYARFKAWFIKEGWDGAQQQVTSSRTAPFRSSESQLLSMLRLADLSWSEIKLSMFKLCCLTPDNLASLASTNASLLYLASNNDRLCQPLSQIDGIDSISRPNGNNRQQFNSSLVAKQELVALELYYYYCVHFNKHHSSKLEFERKFTIFRRNVDSIRRHSCKRSLTLYESLRLRQYEFLNGMDVLDARRSFTDDLNLDRFEYFRLPAFDGNDEQLAKLRRADDLVAVPPRRQQVSYSGAGDGGVLSSRFGFTYRRAPFDELLQQQQQHRQQQDPTEYQLITANSRPTPNGYYSLGERLIELNDDDMNELAKSYHQNNAQKVYDLVEHSYQLCTNSFSRSNINDDQRQASRRQTRCSSTGKFADTGRLRYAHDLAQNQHHLETPSQRITQQQQAAGGRPTLVSGCDYYWQGLDSWAKGLLKPDERFVIALNREAKCVR